MAPFACGSTYVMLARASCYITNVWPTGALTIRTRTVAQEGADTATGMLQVWTFTAVLSAHEGASVTHLDTVALADGSVVVVSTGTDRRVSLWIRHAGTAEWVQHNAMVPHPKQTVECVALSLLPGFTATSSAPRHPTGACFTGVVVATGTVDSAVRLYAVGCRAGGDDGFALTELMSLKGHTDWVRSLHFSYCATSYVRSRRHARGMMASPLGARTACPGKTTI